MKIHAIRSFFVCALAWLALLAAAPAQSAGDWSIDRLMQALAKTRTGHAHFVEKKFISSLDRPLESSGELTYTAPDKLEKRTLKPKQETLLVNGDTLVIELDGRKHTLQLGDYPELAGFIDSIRGTLAGDRKALERLFRLQLDGQAENWALMLWPSDEKLARNVHLIRIAGSRGTVRRIDVIQTDGDRSTMTIDKAESR